MEIVKELVFGRYVSLYLMSMSFLVNQISLYQVIFILWRPASLLICLFTFKDSFEKCVRQFIEVIFDKGCINNRNFFLLLSNVVCIYWLVWFKEISIVRQCNFCRAMHILYCQDHKRCLWKLKNTINRPWYRLIMLLWCIYVLKLLLCY